MLRVAMPDETKPKDLEEVLARLKNEWRELADLLTTQGKSRDRVIEVEQILLRDASGQYRGKISANPEGSTDLLLSDTEGKAWTRLGVNREGEAFLELKDRQGETSFKVAVGAPSPGAETGPAATRTDAPNPPFSQPFAPAGAESAPLAESPPVSAIAPPWLGRQFRGIGPPGEINPSASASEILLGPYPGRPGSHHRHPDLCAAAAKLPRLGRRIVGGTRPQRQYPGLSGR